MKIFFTLIILSFATLILKGQTQPFGKIDTADLKLTTCDFEKDANAMVLFDKAQVYYKYSTIIMLRHKRIKIFNDNGKDAAKVRIEFDGAHNDESISDIKAQTINLEHNSITYIPVDKSLIYKQDIDKESKAIIFTFPNVKPGSVIEFSYKWSTPYAGNFPNWFFQSDIPARYSEFQGDFNNDYTFKIIRKVYQKLAKDTSIFLNGKNDNQGKRFIWALSNVHTLKEEPYMTPLKENIQGILFQVSRREATWINLIRGLLRDEDFGLQLDSTINLNDEEKILTAAYLLKTRDEKISYIFSAVKANVKWNDFNGVFTNDGIKKAWNKKTGNSAELNLILCHLLKKTGIPVYPLLVNTHGKIDERYATFGQLNKIVGYISIDSTKKYVLDAAGPYNRYNEIPFYLLNSNGLMVDPISKGSRFLILQDMSPLRKVVFVNAQIMADGKMTGTTQINTFGHDKIVAQKKYKDDGEKKYIDYLRDDDNNLKISSLKLENMEVDSLPLTQNIEFNLELPGSDDNYIYFSPNLFTGLYTNPFLSEDRISDIDFKYCNNYTISGRYKIPTGYKLDALPKSANMFTPDKSIGFKRATAEEDGYVLVHYSITFKRSIYPKDEYPDIHAFYKKMHEMLNEQIVLKKM
ncbi:MAG TPA: DUF3857 domain-containing protein [Mucilaginibacter sp.]|nr:DUF3857 domain-containing protein [Mucilaginibacter sp.]